MGIFLMAADFTSRCGIEGRVKMQTLESMEDMKDMEGMEGAMEALEAF